jgi:hypothetical protein
LAFTPLLYSKSLPADEPREDFARCSNYRGLGVDVVVLVDDSVVVPGDEVVVVFVLVDGELVVVVLLLLELEPPPAGEGFTTVVLFSVFEPGDPAGATVSDFCSHDTRSAALAMMQRYFFIIVWIGQT